MHACVYVSMKVMYYEYIKACLEKSALIYWPVYQYRNILLISLIKDFFGRINILQEEHLEILAVLSL
jgi:hypothetical protein